MFVLKEMRRGLRAEEKWNKGRVVLRARPHQQLILFVKRKCLRNFLQKAATGKKCYANVIQEGNRFQLKWLKLAALAR